MSQLRISIVHDFAFAPYRFYSELGSDQNLGLCYVAFALSQAEDSSSKVMNREQQDLATDAVKVCSKENGVYLGLHVDLQSKGNALLNALQGDDTDPATVPRKARHFIDHSDVLYNQARIFRSDSGQTVTRIICNQMRAKNTFLF